jgi:hypothetical protein
MIIMATRSRRLVTVSKSKKTSIPRLAGWLSGKGVTGKVLTMVVTLIVAAAALILLWAFLTNSMPLITQSVENMIRGFKNSICENMPPIIKNICQWGIGA